ncbi:glycosyltransferase family protein [Flammeovirga kamogawensis]|uniref:Glycosyltransferase n=1 Tax=Flammeovirga kamogawensis TaxID=373891 RepID=A0ABX8GWR9_9BACT|nr:sugar transferase [Flammeovirga kamogawensis]MBB6461214.1 GT2 family glycosyltransferase [Flammeovirga kamogawensis]QWG07776.1 hypothetical protein KM029_02215 [Flammeovirga kamogawensis]TRX69582.1 sugar transferase [Flammeovirga kamogawensis]
MNTAPIIVFSYNRSTHTQKVLEALKKNTLFNESPLYLFCDGLKENASEVDRNEHKRIVDIIHNEDNWTKDTTVVVQSQNLGLAKSIVQGVSKVIKKHGSAIILEDDIIVTSGFLAYMNDALQVYKDDPSVMHVNAYLPKSPFQKNKFTNSTFFSSHMSCWGWATWESSWNKFTSDSKQLFKEIEEKDLLSKIDLNGSFIGLEQLQNNIDGKISTWAIKWLATILINNGLCLNPSLSLVQNIGMDGSGVNSGLLFWNPYLTKQTDTITIDKNLSKDTLLGDKYFEKFYRYVNVKGYKRFLIKLYFYILNRIFKVDTL